MSFGGRFGVVLCRFRVGSFRPRKSQPYSLPCFTNFHPTETFFCAKFPKPPSASIRKSAVRNRKSPVRPFSMCTFQFSIFNPRAHLPKLPKISHPRKYFPLTGSHWIRSLSTFILTHSIFPNPTQSNKTQHFSPLPASSFGPSKQSNINKSLPYIDLQNHSPPATPSAGIAHPQRRHRLRYSKSSKGYEKVRRK